MDKQRFIDFLKTREDVAEECEALLGVYVDFLVSSGLNSLADVKYKRKLEFHSVGSQDIEYEDYDGDVVFEIPTYCLYDEDWRDKEIKRILQRRADAEEARQQELLRIAAKSEADERKLLAILKEKYEADS